MKPKAFNFYLDYLENIEDLSDEQIGVLTRALLIYANTGEVIEMELAVKQTFKPIKKQMDIEFENYAQVAEKRSAAGKSGGRPKKDEKAKENSSEEKANGSTEEENIIEIKAKKANAFLSFDEESKKSKSIENENENENENNISFVQAFDDFWNAYPKKRNKPAAERAFKRLKVNQDLLTTMLNAIKKQIKTRGWQDIQYIPNPSSWLNGRMWEDKITQADITPPNKYTQSYIQREEDYDEMEGFSYLLELEDEE